MAVQYVKINKYNEITEYPEVDLIFTGPKKLLVDRVSGKSLQFTRNTTGTYVDANGIIQTAAAGEPRYTYDPATGEELGLLVEESATNSEQYSQGFTSGWSLSYAQTTTGQSDPMGGTDAILVKQTNGTSTRQFISSVTGLNFGSNAFTVSVFVKYVNYDYVIFTGTDQDNGTSGNRIGYLLPKLRFQFSTETIAFQESTWPGSTETLNYGFKKYPNGWYRLWITRNISVRTNRWGIAVQSDYAVGISDLNFVTGDNSSSVLAFGFQVEQGSFPTSYIPTSGSTVTRDPDTVTLTNDNLYNNSQFDIVNDPFGMSAGSNTLTLLPSNSENSAIKRVTIFSPNITQTKINTFAEKEDEFWRWRVRGSSFELPIARVNGSGVTLDIDWGDGTIENYSSGVISPSHTYTDGKEYHEIGFKVNGDGNFQPSIYNEPGKEKVIAVGPAPESVKFYGPQAFWGCSNLTAFDATVTVPGGNFIRAWQDCSSLKSFPLINTSGVTDLQVTWYNCSSLTSFPPLDTSSVTRFQSTWQNCTGLTSFPLLDTSSGTDFQSAWNTCNSLTSFPEINTSSGTLFYRAWQNCSSLTSFPANFFDSWTATPANNCFVGTWDGCSSLTATSVENILNSIDTSGRSAPASGVDITIDFNASSGTPNISTAVSNLKGLGWTITLNGVAQ